MLLECRVPRIPCGDFTLILLLRVYQYPGSCIQCKHKSCLKAFHASCALVEPGVWLELCDSEGGKWEDSTVCWCAQHNPYSQRLQDMHYPDVPVLSKEQAREQARRDKQHAKKFLKTLDGGSEAEKRVAAMFIGDSAIGM